MIKGCLGAKLTNVFVLAPSYKRIFLTQWCQIAKKNNNNNNKLSKQITHAIYLQNRSLFVLL